MTSTEERESAEDLLRTTDRLFDFEGVRDNVESLVEAEEYEAARELLERATEMPDVQRTVEENLWVYRTLGEVREEEGRREEAIRAYRNAFEFDPRDREVLGALSDLLTEESDAIDSDFALEVLQSLLVHHLSELDPEARADLYRQLGLFYEQEGDYQRARSNFEQAVEYTGSDERALTGLLRAVGAVGEPTDVIEVRRKLIDAFQEPQARSMALVALGDDWIERFNDPARAIDTYEDAIDEHSDNERAYKKLYQAAQQSGDWSRVYSACLELGRLADSDEDEAEWVIQASNIARDKMWEPERALTGFRRALELDPTRFDAFKAVTQILIDARDWDALERAYLEQIEGHKKREDSRDELLAVLWQNLGDLYAMHLDDDEAAITAYHKASQILPDNLQFHDKAASLAEEMAEQSAVALEHLRAIWERDSSRLDVLDRMGRVYLRREEVDPALCHFRAIDFLGGKLEEKPRSFVERFQSNVYKTPDRPLDWPTLRSYVAPDSLDPNVSEVFRILYPVLVDWTAERRSEYGLGRGDQMDLDQPLAFANIYREVGESLGYSDLPDLWRKSDQKGLIKAALKPPALIVGDDIITSGNEKQMAFAIGKKLFLHYKPFYLVGLRSMSDLQAFFLLAVQLVNPDFEMERSEQMEQAYRKIESQVTGDQREALAEAVDAATAGGQREVVLGEWTEAIEDAANRVGMLFCDDLAVCAARLRSDPQKFSERDIHDRMHNLAKYTVSERYLSLRDDLGLGVST